MSWLDGTPGSPAGVSDRVVGVDVARGVALLGMIAVHLFATLSQDGSPTAATVVFGGRAAAIFALLAGVSLAFLSGGAHVVEGHALVAARVGIAVRALLIGAIGLLLGYVTDLADVILVYYALLFLIAIPLLALRPQVLVGVAVTAIAVGPLLVLATFGADLPSISGSPTLSTLIEDPAGLVAGLLVTGTYPAVVYLVYLAGGLAIGRLDLSSGYVAGLLLAGGLGLAVAARAVSWLLLVGLHKLEHLGAAAPSRGEDLAAANRILWDPHPTSSWWWLALSAPHSHATLDVVHTLGSAIAVLGAALLLARIPLVARLLWPVAAAGTMTLTFYSAHLVVAGVLGADLVEDHPAAVYLLMVLAVLVIAPLWLRWRRQGPLEQLVSAATRRARHDMLARWE